MGRTQARNALCLQFSTGIRDLQAVARLVLIEVQAMGRAETLYSELQDGNAIDGLIGQPEDSHLDCKEWPTDDG